MEQWQDVSNSILSADNLSIASLSSIVNNIVETYGAKPVELLTFNNSYVFSNVNTENHTDSFPGITLINEWSTGTSFDVIGTANWGLRENIEEYTYETSSLAFNPHLELYGYAEAFFEMTFEWFYFKAEVFFEPFDITPLSLDL